MGILVEEDGRELEKERRLNQLYLAIISRYRDVIEAREHVSVAELPSFVTPKDELVIKKADEIKSAFGSYSYDSHFYEASINAFHFVRNNVGEVSMPVQFWLRPEETLSFGVGDIIDKSTLLCSLLIALGNPASKVLVSIKETGRKVLTYYEFSGKAYLLDFASGFRRFGSREALIKSQNINDDTTCYEFNDNMYIEIS